MDVLKSLTQQMGRGRPRRAKTYRVLAPRSFLELTEKEVDRALRYDRSLSAMMIQIDWESVLEQNDDQAVRDAIIAKFAEAVVKSVRAADTVGRLGIDEFAMLMPETRPAQAEVPALNLCDMALNAPIETPAGARTLRLFVGIAGLNPRMRDASALLSVAAQEVRRAREGAGAHGPISIAEQEQVRLSVPRNPNIH